MNNPDKHRQQKPSLPGSLVDAWIGYAIDPRRWEQLTTELASNSGLLAQLDPNDFLASFAKAEALSWRIRSEEGSMPGGFAYVVLDKANHVIERRDELALLDPYLAAHHGAQLAFAHDESTRLFSRAQQQLADSSGHILIELRDSLGDRVRFGYLLSRQDFPASLIALGNSATYALLVPEASTNPAVKRTLRDSFGLSNAETEVAMALAGGLTLKEVADSLGISINTARNQLQSTFSKTGISRQTELILIITQLGVIVATSSSQPEFTEPVADYPELQMMSLADGRALAFRCYGEPTGAPVLYLHESYATSRLPAEVHDWAQVRNLLIVAPDRPGYGFSSPAATQTLASAAADLRQLVRRFGWTSFSVCGYLTGAAFALELAHDPGARLERIMLVAGRVPAAGHREGNDTALERFRLAFIDHPWMLNSVFNILRNRSNPRLFAALMRRAYGTNAKDLALLDESPQLLNHTVQNCVESQSVSSTGVVHDMRALTNGFTHPPTQLRVPIEVWHGAADRVARPELLRKALRDCPVRWRDFPGEGALVFYRHLEEWVDALAIAPGLNAPRLPR